MPATELAEWALLYRDSPFGEFRADLRSGIVASVVARTQGNTNAKPSDFMPYFMFERPASAGPARPVSAKEREVAQVTHAFMKATSKLRHHVIKRKPKDGNGLAR
jgi:uncharacterized protein DUF4035